MADTAPKQQYTLTATYTSPTNAAFKHEQPLQTPPTTSPKDRVAYLAALGTATVELQERINKELTERMEEDKARDVQGAAVGGKAVDEKKEEENYGEEVVEED